MKKFIIQLNSFSSQNKRDIYVEIIIIGINLCHERLRTLIELQKVSRSISICDELFGSVQSFHTNSIV